MQECKIPQNITAEQNVLSAMLISAEAIDTVAEILKPEDFYRPSHRIIYQVMLALHAKEQPVDLITVIEELKRRNKLDDVGGVNYVTLLGELAVTAANVEWHAKLWRTRRCCGRWRKAATKLPRWPAGETVRVPGRFWA